MELPGLPPAEQIQARAVQHLLDKGDTDAAIVLRASTMTLVPDDPAILDVDGHAVEPVLRLPSEANDLFRDTRFMLAVMFAIHHVLPAGFSASGIRWYPSPEPTPPDVRQQLLDILRRKGEGRGGGPGPVRNERP